MSEEDEFTELINNSISLQETLVGKSDIRHSLM